MPSATRKMNAKSGNAGSAFAKWKTWLKTSALTPRVAANDSTTDRISSTGASSARSNKPSTMKITTRTIGMINRLSLREASWMSR
jgi:hypothetical protein